MIAELLDEDFLAGAAERTRLGLGEFVAARERRQGSDEGPLAEFTAAELAEVVTELDRVLDGDGTEHRPRQRLEMPREPILAILQTELSRVIREGRPEMLLDDPDSPVDQRIDLPDPGDTRRRWGRFEVAEPRILSDPRWLWSGIVIAWHRFKRKAPFGGLPEQAVTIADDARIVLVGDWGSGLERAQGVARQMRRVLDEGREADREQHVVHLGDVYYTGAKQEYEERFLRYWPVRPGEPIGSFTLAGNHDMYRGGHAYYETALGDQRFARQERKSVFSLRSRSWQILGLDTAYVDERLACGQPAWISQQLADAPSLRTVLLSHHQLWSPYERAGDGLRDDLVDVLPSGRIDAWFWAHEHRCIAFEPREGVGFASCIGHGGIPEYLVGADDWERPPGVRYEQRERRGPGTEPWGTFGFAVVDLDGPSMTVRYVDEEGRHHHTEEIPGA